MAQDLFPPSEHTFLGIGNISYSRACFPSLFLYPRPLLCSRLSLSSLLLTPKLSLIDFLSPLPLLLVVGSFPVEAKNSILCTCYWKREETQL